MKKSELEALAQAKIDDAVLLLQSGRPSNAYYLAGYSIEFAIKACIASQFRAEDIPDVKLVRDVYTHNLVTLIGLAGLKQLLERQIAANTGFAANWGIVKDWAEGSRYESWTIGDAQYLISAIIHPTDGVLPWIKNHW